MQSYIKGEVVENVSVSSNIYKVTLKGEFTGKPGQFYMLNAWDNTEPYLSRPISIHDICGENISFLYEVKGKGTNIMKNLSKGQYIKALGPLGNGFDTDKIHGRIAVVSGGIGIAPMNYLIKELKGNTVDLYAGFRDESYGIDEVRECLNDVFISTESGNEGYKGFVTDMLNPWDYSLVLCCGPKVMMKKVAEMCDTYCTSCLVSMEQNMACGIGACLVCTCDTVKGKKRVCKDGPVFWGRDVVLGA